MKVLAFAGSARTASCNQGVVRYLVAAASRVAPELEITILDPSKWPLFCSDLIVDGQGPAEVMAGIEAAYEAQAFIICTPEYNYSMAPVTTNTVAWLSKPLGGKAAAPMEGKPLGLLSAGGGLGGMRAQLHARNAFPVFLNMPVMLKPEVAIRVFSEPKPFDMATGELNSEAEGQKLDVWLAAFQAWAVKLSLMTLKL